MESSETGKAISEAIIEGFLGGLEKIWWVFVLFIVFGIIIIFFQKWAYGKIDKLKGKNSRDFFKNCPKCNGGLIERSGKYGKFLGCSNYPKCKYTENIEK